LLFPLTSLCLFPGRSLRKEVAGRYGALTPWAGFQGDGFSGWEWGRATGVKNNWRVEGGSQRCNTGRRRVSTLHINISPITGIAIDGFVAVLGARIRMAGGGDKKRVGAQTGLG
jgi:hypothetical protein